MRLVDRLDREPIATRPMSALDDRPAGQPVITEQFIRKRPGGPPGPLSMADRCYRILRSGSRKLVVSSRGDVLLFDLASDPGVDGPAPTMDPEAAARLRALGYAE